MKIHLVASLFDIAKETETKTTNLNEQFTKLQKIIKKHEPTLKSFREALAQTEEWTRQNR